MKVNLYSGYSTIKVALHAGKDSVVRYYPMQQNIVEIMQTIFPNMELEFNRNYPLLDTKLDNGVRFAYTVHGGQTPFTEQLEQVDAGETHAIVLQPGGPAHMFGLKGMGLFPLIETEIEDIAAAYKASDSIVEFWTENEFNAYFDADGDMHSGKNTAVSSIDEDYITPLDNYYSIAARELAREGVSFEGVDRSTPDLNMTQIPAGSNLEIHMGYEAYSCDYIPVFDEIVVERAQQYYREGVPDKYKWLENVQPLDFLSLWALELGKTYTLRAHCPLGSGIMFDDEVEFQIAIDTQFNSRYITTTSPTGEPVKLEDHIVPEWVHSFAAVTGEGAAELANKGFPYRDMLNLKRSLQI